MPMCKQTIWRCKLATFNFIQLSSKFKSSAGMHRAKSKLFPWEKQSWKQPRVSLSKVLGGQRTWRRLCLPGPNVFLCKRGRKERLGFGTEADKGILWNPSDLEMNWHLHQGLPVELYPEVNPCYVGDAWWLVLNIPACSSFRKRMEEAEVLNGTGTFPECQGLQHRTSVAPGPDLLTWQMDSPKSCSIRAPQID